MSAPSVPAGSAPGPSPPLWALLSAAADAVQAVHEGRSLSDRLPAVPAPLRPGTQALAFHALRWVGSAAEVCAHLAPKSPPPEVESLLLVALALLWPAGPPPYAEHTLVNQAVAAARRRTPAAAGFVNAVLRRFLREREACVAAAQRRPTGRFNHPGWWVERVHRDWPAQAEALLVAANQHPPMTLRVNRRQGSVDDYRRRLAGAGLAAAPPPDPADATAAPDALVLSEPCPVTRLPGFADGAVSVQDAAAQRAVPLLLGRGTARLPPGARVLDACAAPGGKTAHLLEQADLDVLALDSDAERLERVRQTLQRLQLPAAGSQAALRAADARHPASWWDGRPFDAILLDAPCTASGIVRRHPDIRWLRRPGDAAALATVQGELLDALWPLLRPGGRLLYATCSLFRAEGQDVVDAFLQREAGRTARLDPASPGHLLPVPDNPDDPAAAARDGFFYALMHKT